MSIDFRSPSYRAASSDLTISISPLGLVELADEEFEVHGPRLNRYAQNWAYYLGHHWGYMRELGEPQLTFNYVRAMADYINNFVFGRGISFRSPKETEAIVPQLLQRVWEIDNDKKKLIWEMGNQGGISGDNFVKVAYDEPYITGIDSEGNVIDGVPQMQMPGKVRILPLNSSFCLPVEDTEVLTNRGWLSADEVQVGYKALALDPNTDELVWTDVEAVNVFDWDGPMARWKNERFDALSTPDHRWITQSARGKRSIRTTEELHGLSGGGAGCLVVAGGTPMAFSEIAKWDDDFVELVGWFVTEGHWHSGTGTPMFTQSEEANPDFVARIRRLVKVYEGSEYVYEGKANQWYVPTLRDALHDVVGDGKELTAEFLTSLTYPQARLLYETLLDGDGHRGVTTTWAQSHTGRMDSFQMLAMMLGYRTQARWRQREIGNPCGEATVYGNRTLNIQNLERTEEHFSGRVWCPTTGTGTWIARRKGTTFHTGNCFPEFHPHDRTRLIRFKLKYRFWGCVDTKTEALTRQGWKTHDQLQVGDEILALDPETDEIRWQPVQAVNVYDYDGHMVAWDNHIDAVTTPNHRWLVERQRGRAATTRYERGIARTEFALEGDPAIKDLRQSSRIIVGGGTPLAFPSQAKYSDELVETVGWYVTEGWDHVNQTGAKSIYIAQKRPEGLVRIRRLKSYWESEGATFSEYAPKKDGVISFYLGKGVGTALREVSPAKALTPEFISALTFIQAELLYNTLMLADGNVRRGSERWTQTDPDRVDGFQMLCALLGKRTAQTSCGEKVQVYKRRHILTNHTAESARRVHTEDGQVWCPTVEGGIWFARRNGSTYWTGNTALEGTRQVFTYCTDDQTEALTRRGWLKHDQITTDDEVLALDPQTDDITWQPVLAVNRFDWDGPLTRWQNTRMDALTTPHHRWLVQDWRARDPSYAHLAQNRFKVTEQLSGGRGSDQIVVGGGTPMAFATQPKWADDLVETIGWIVTEGHYAAKTGVIVAQSPTANPEYCSRIRRLASWWKAEGAFVSEKQYSYDNCIHWYFGKGANAVIREVAPDKQLTPEFLCSLTYAQAKLLYDTLIDGDGHRRKDTGLETWAQKDAGRIDGFQMLCAMLGRRTNRRESQHHSGSDVSVYTNRNMTASEVNARDEHYTGIVWCPSVPTKTWLARRNGTTYWTGNTEVMTDTSIEEYINDELIDNRPNPLGEIPIAFAPNIPISGSPWGLSDIQDIVSLNREYNEKATDISDIINYHAAPVTVVVGAKASNLEKGPKKVWGGLPKDSQVYNLELSDNLAGPLQFLEILKRAMHEMTGVPETALGQMQPISNTSGVALAIQYQPLMNRRELKVTQYGSLFDKINYFVLKTLALKEPMAMYYDPTIDVPLKDGQLDVLDPADPITYRSSAHFQPPLPIDALIKLNEIQSKMMLGIESKRGALQELGEEFPDQKMQELFAELVQDAKEQGALDLLRAEIASAIATLTGIVVGPDGSMGPAGDGSVASAGGSDVNQASDAGQQEMDSSAALPGTEVEPSMDVQQIMTDLTTLAYGTKIPQRRNPKNDEED